MGCDIHIYLEYKKHINGESKWVSADYFKLNPYYPDDEGYEQQYNIVEIYNGRNYELFSVLADVRNYNDIDPIVDPRGIPSDCCSIIREEYERWDSDGHSHSYLSLKELEDYAAKQIKTKYKGYMSKENAEEVDKGEMPSEWCKWASESLNYVYREWEYEENILEPIISGIKNRLKEGFYFWDDEQIEKQAKDIRIVFWFDN